jgi:hypothetical protein
LNGEQIAAEREVNSGDRLRVGPLEFDVKIEVGAPAAKPATAEPAAKPAPAKAPAAKPKLVPAAAAVATDTVPEGGTSSCHRRRMAG